MDAGGATPEAATSPSTAVRSAEGSRRQEETVALVITSTPAGAQVELDGAIVGRTPVHVARLAPGTHRVRVSRPGYAPVGRTVRILGGTRLVLDLRLARPAGPAGLRVPRPRPAGPPLPPPPSLPPPPPPPP